MEGNMRKDALNKARQLGGGRVFGAIVKKPMPTEMQLAVMASLEGERKAWAAEIERLTEEITKLERDTGRLRKAAVEIASEPVIGGRPGVRVHMPKTGANIKAAIAEYGQADWNDAWDPEEREALRAAQDAGRRLEWLRKRLTLVRTKHRDIGLQIKRVASGA